MSRSLEVLTPPEDYHAAERAEKTASSVNVSALAVTENHQVQKFEVEDHPIDEVPILKAS